MREYMKKGGFLISKDGTGKELPPYRVVDLSYQEAKEIMDGAKYMLEEYVDGPPFWKTEITLNRPLINVNDKWLRLGRTDWKDDVATGLCARKTLNEWLEMYKLRNMDTTFDGCSARMDDVRFSVIDQFSDG